MLSNGAIDLGHQSIFSNGLVEIECVFCFHCESDLCWSGATDLAIDLPAHVNSV